jgi:hypothetical protein
MLSIAKRDYEVGPESRVPKVTFPSFFVVVGSLTDWCVVGGCVEQEGSKSANDEQLLRAEFTIEDTNKLLPSY